MSNDNIHVKFELHENNEGRKYWRSWHDGVEAPPTPAGITLEIPSERNSREHVDYPAGTTVELHIPRTPKVMANVQEVKDRLVEELIKNDPGLTNEGAEALLYEKLTASQPTEFSKAIVKGTEDKA